MRHITTAVCILLCSVAMTSCGQQSGGIEGAWQLAGMTVTSADNSVVTIEDLGTAQLMLQGGQYSQVWMQSGRLYSIPPTNLEKIDAYDSFDASAGVYTYTNGTLTLTPQIARDPDSVGKATTTTITLDGDTMTRTRERSDPNDPAQTIQWTSTYTRIR